MAVNPAGAAAQVLVAGIQVHLGARAWILETHAAAVRLVRRRIADRFEQRIHRWSGPEDVVGEVWQRFIAWSGLTQLREVITLDSILCPSIFQELMAEDWEHNVQEDFKTHLFFDLDHVLKKVVGAMDWSDPQVIQFLDEVISRN